MWCPALRAVKYAGTEAERWELQEELSKGEHVGANVIVTAFTTFGKESDKVGAREAARGGARRVQGGAREERGEGRGGGTPSIIVPPIVQSA